MVADLKKKKKKFLIGPTRLFSYDYLSMPILKRKSGTCDYAEE